MTKTLIIHIGHYKTGTTALQVFLEENAPFLETIGCEYSLVRLEYSKHSDFAFSILRAAGVENFMHGYGKPYTPREMWGELFETIENSDLETTIISSEELMRIGQFPAAAKILGDVLKGRPEGLNVRAIVYLRDPASHLESWYNQLIKMEFPLPELNQAVDCEIEDIHFDYRRAINPWVDLLGPENVIVRPYIDGHDDPAALHRDFLKAIGVETKQDLAVEFGNLNPRLDDRAIELLRLMQNMEFPPVTIERIRTQLLSYLEIQDARALEKGGGMEMVRARARAGVEWLSDLPLSAIPVEDFTNALPEEIPQQKVETNLLMGFIFSELIRLRQRVNRIEAKQVTARITELERKIQELEARE